MITTVPVVKRQPICESGVERVFDIPGSILYRVEATRPDGLVQVFDTRAYTDSLTSDIAGRLAIVIRSKSKSIWSGTVSYPYNYLCRNDVLCSLKINTMRIRSDEVEGQWSFALNYNLFCLPWTSCVIVHRAKGDDKISLVFTSRGEWEHGVLGHANQELQMFLRVDETRMTPIDMVKSSLESSIVEWLERCRCEMVRKHK